MSQLKFDEFSFAAFPYSKYLFSLNINNGKLENNQLSFNNNDYQLLSFTDRPFRYSSGNEDGAKAEQELNFLFNQDNSFNSFTK